MAIMNWDHAPGEQYPWKMLCEAGDELEIYGLIPPLTIRDSLKRYLASNPGLQINLLREHRTMYRARRSA